LEANSGFADEAQQDSAARVGVDNPDPSLPLDEETISDPEHHWSLGAPQPLTTTMALPVEQTESGNPVYLQFDRKLRTFLKKHVSEEPISDHDIIKASFVLISFPTCLRVVNQLRPFHCLYLKYQSLEDWTQSEDILQCNPNFHGKPRYDSVLVNTDSPSSLTCVKLQGLFRCILPSRVSYDIALVQTLKPDSWKPHTAWDGCRVYCASKTPTFIKMEYFIRGVCLCHAFNTRKERIFYLNNLIDPDIFLRAGN